MFNLEIHLSKLIKQHTSDLRIPLYANHTSIKKKKKNTLPQHSFSAGWSRTLSCPIRHPKSLLWYVKSTSTMATVTIKIDNKIKMDRGHRNLRTAHQEQFIFSRKGKIEGGEGVFHSPCTLKNSHWVWLFLLKEFYGFPGLREQKRLRAVISYRIWPLKKKSVIA